MTQQLDAVQVPSGTYVIAVSGGVDSMVLLDVISRQTDVKLVVAHYDHGIRADSDIDASIVKDAARSMNLEYFTEYGNLGEQASESSARNKRYEFLNRIKISTAAQGIITAHHQDDVLETAIFNISRGTNRLGLTSLASNELILRPFLDIPKTALYDYAHKNKLVWREDDTNSDTTYSRNMIRHMIVSKMNADDRSKLVSIIFSQRHINADIRTILDEFLSAYADDNSLDRSAFINLPHVVSKEVMAHWLRQNGIRDFDRKLLEKLTVYAKVGRIHSRMDIVQNQLLLVTENQLALKRLDR